MEAYLLASGCRVGRNGSEHTIPGFVSQIRNVWSPCALLLRHSPDGVLIQPDGVVRHWEAKVEDSMEKHAFQAYRAYQRIGADLVIFVKVDTAVYRGSFGRMKFIRPEITLSNHRTDKYNWPIIDGWLVPKGHPNFIEKKSSGNPYLKINLKTLKPLPHFQEVVETYRSKLTP